MRCWPIECPRGAPYLSKMDLLSVPMVVSHIQGGHIERSHGGATYPSWAD